VADLLGAVRAALRAARPDVLLISAGFDSLAGDPLGGFTLEPEDLARVASELRAVVAPAPVVAVLEGGYRPSRVAAGVCAVVRALA
jgi:acetoin utilization deacetylase AcuC-like enzyme